MMHTIHLVSHTHWDREWYLTFQQFRLKLIHLIDRLLDILENDPDFRNFLLDGQAIILEDYLQIRPEREADLVRFVKSGRLLIGPWYVSPDEFLISPESHIRNLLEGDRLCQHFGEKMLVGYLPDTFGHIGQMPQILRGFGINTACLWRGLADQPCELIWKAPDGSSVLLSYMRDGYSNAASLTTSNLVQFNKEIDTLSLVLTPYSVTSQILLMHGTDHMEPLPDLTNALGAYNSYENRNYLIHSNLQQYFEEVLSHINSTGRDLPIVAGELRSSKHTAILQNVLSTRIWLKQRNHDCENELLKWIEPLNAWCSQLKTSQHDPVPVMTDAQHDILTNRNPIIRHAWKLLMQCHPHDSICGTSIDQVANEMRIRFDQVDQINHELVSQCLQKISDHIDTRPIHYPILSNEPNNNLSAIVVFNPNDSPQTGLTHIKMTLEKPNSSFEIIDDHGNTTPFDQTGMGRSELISMTLDKKSLKQALGMIHEGKVAGMVIREFGIVQQEKQCILRATLSDHAEVDVNKWKAGIAKLELMLANPEITEYIIQAYSYPEINISLVAQDVPGHGIRCYWIREYAVIRHKPAEKKNLTPLIHRLLPLFSQITRVPLISKQLTGRKRKLSKALYKIENEYFLVEVSPSASALSVMDKRTGQIYNSLNRFVDSADCGDLYNYCPPERDFAVTANITRFEYDIQKTYQKLVIHSDLRIPTKIADDRKSRYPKIISNPITSIITVVPGVPRIDIHTEIKNFSLDHRLRVQFLAPFRSSFSLHDGHFEVVRRQVGIPDFDKSWEEPPRPEVPECQYTSITNDEISLTIANRGLPEVEVINNDRGDTELAVTLLRCVGWLSRDDLKTRKGHAGPMGIATPDAQMIGKFEFDYSIIPGGADLQASIHQAYSFNAPLKSILARIHPGTLPSRCAFIENNNKDFIITAIKNAEAEQGLIVRGFNMLSSPIDVSLKPWRPFNHAQLVGLDETLVSTVPISPQGSINLHAEGNKIVTIRLTD